MSNVNISFKQLDDI